MVSAQKKNYESRNRGLGFDRQNKNWRIISLDHIRCAVCALRFYRVVELLRTHLGNKMNPLYKPSKSDSERANRYRNVLSALENLTTQLNSLTEGEFIGRAEDLFHAAAMAQDCFDERLEAERRKKK